MRGLIFRNSAKVNVFTASTGGSQLLFNGTDNKFASSSEYKLVARSAYRAMFFEENEDCGVATGSTNNTLTDTTKDWGPLGADYWKDGYIEIVEGTGYSEYRNKRRRQISGNTSDTITVTSNWEENPDETSRYVLIKESKKWKDGKPAFWPVRTYLTSGRPTEQETYQSNIDAIYLTLINPVCGLGLSPGDYIKIPALFKGIPDETPASAEMPGMVNLLVCGTTVVVPKPFGPKNPTIDIFEDDVSTKLGAIGITVKFVDDWNTYHVEGGEIHCGTNVKRTPPGIDWW